MVIMTVMTKTLVVMMRQAVAMAKTSGSAMVLGIVLEIIVGWITMTKTMWRIVMMIMTMRKRKRGQEWRVLEIITSGSGQCNHHYQLRILRGPRVEFVEHGVKQGGTGGGHE